MEITDFLTQNFLSSFTGTLVAVERNWMGMR